MSVSWWQAGLGLLTGAALELVLLERRRRAHAILAAAPPVWALLTVLRVAVLSWGAGLIYSDAWKAFQLLSGSAR